MAGKGIAALIIASKKPSASAPAEGRSDAHEAGAEAVKAFSEALNAKDFAAAFSALHDAMECAEGLPEDAAEEGEED